SRKWVGGGEVDKPQFWIDSGRLPDARTAPHPDVGIGRPGLRAKLAWCGNGVESPYEFAGFGVIGLDPATNSTISAGEAGDDHPVIVEWRGSDGEAILPALGLHRPDHLAGVLVEREQLAVELADEHLVIAVADSTAHPATAGRRERRIKTGRV